MFSDESAFPVSGFHNAQNHRVYAASKDDIPDEELFVEKESYPKALMVWSGVSMRGKLPLIFREKGCKVNAHSYQHIFKKVIPATEHLHGRKWTLQQDGVTFHTAKSTINFIEDHIPSFIRPGHWPANSPDLNPLDYSI